MLAHRVLGLPAHPASAGLARRLVSETLMGSGIPDDVADSAQLLVSEVVTNAIVHARSDVGLTVSVSGGEVRVEVSDHSPHVPAPRAHDHSAITGRGLELVSALADSFGVRIVDDTGKVVWFTVGGQGQERNNEEHGATRASIELRRATTEVLLLGVPVVLFRAWEQHAAALLRESLWVHLASDTQAAEQEIDEIAAVNEALAVLGEQAARAIDDTSDDVSRTLDLAVAIPLDVVPRFALLPATLNRALDLAAAGKLLTPTSQPEVVALRNWLCDEVVRQGTGLSPSPWTGLNEHHAEPHAPQKRPPDWDTAAVDASDQAVIAADDSNRIVAASAAVAELLGWTRAELVGQRIVSIVPEELRERHIAGFTRYLITGQAHIIGSPVTVPARCRSGKTVDVLLTLEVVEAAGGRTIFVGTLEPVLGD